MHAVVIGGGLVGASAAYRLARRGATVTLVDRADPGQATAAGAGIVCPAVYLSAPPAFFPLSFRAVAYYPEMLAQLAEDGERETGYEEVGLLFIAANEAEAAELPAVQRLVEERRRAGVQNIGALSRLSGAAARELFPPLADIPAALHLSRGARVDGRLLRDALIRAAQRHGAAVVHGSAELVRSRGRVTGVRAEGRVLAADAVLIAGGAWTGAMGEALGVQLPVRPQRGQILHLQLPGVNTGAWPIVEGFHSHYLLTFRENRVVAGATREDETGYDCRLTAGGVHEVLSEALRVAPGLAGGTVGEFRVGFRPFSPDRLPLLGRVPGHENVFVATGNGSSGLQNGPYCGAAAADLLLGRPDSLDLTPYSPARFVS